MAIHDPQGKNQPDRLPIHLALASRVGVSVSVADGQFAVMSLHNWDLFTQPQFIGLGNYQRMIQDDLFWRSLRNTLYYVGFRVPLVLVLALVVAILLNQRSRGGAFCARPTTCRS